MDANLILISLLSIKERNLTFAKKMLMMSYRCIFNKKVDGNVGNLMPLYQFTDVSIVEHDYEDQEDYYHLNWETLKLGRRL